MNIDKAHHIQIVEQPYVSSAALFDSVANQAWAVFLDSGNVSDRAPRAESERYDVIAVDPIATLVTEGDSTRLESKSGCSFQGEDPLLVLKNTLTKLLPGLSNTEQAYLPGAYGYFSYDLSRRFESLPIVAEDPENLPEMALGVYSVVVVVDHQIKKTHVISYHHDSAEISLSGLCSESQTTAWLDRIKIIKRKKTVAGEMPLQSSVLRENQTRDQYRERFRRIRKYTIDGDCYQVNYTKRFSCEVTGSAWATYQNLRISSPAPYGAFLKLPFAQVLSNSPESFIRCRERQVTTSPIKGTRPRDHNNAAKDKAIAKQLETSVKDRAENLMIVDLMRNDLSRSCELGSVKVPKLFALHSFANVHHLISTVVGVLRKNVHSLDLLRNCFPGGSITGAPKLRAMEIIEELEPDRRGLYCGSIGYVGCDGNLETNIAIRTIVVKDGAARFSAGGGLVIDSDSEDEYQELLDKSRMMKQALGN